MKKWMIILSFFILSFEAIAQELSYTDAIFPHKGEVIYPDKILQIHAKKMVEYIKNGDTLSVRADAITVHGTYLNMGYLIRATNYGIMIPIDSATDLSYNGKNYFYYMQKYTKGIKPFRSGLTITIIGANALALGSILYIDARDADMYSWQPTFAQFFLVSGIITLSIGAPLLVLGSTIKINNKQAMNKCANNKELSLNFSINKHGIGLALHF